MKSKLIKASIILVLIASTFIILNTKPQKNAVDQHIKNNYHFSGVTQLNNSGFTTESSEPVQQYDMTVVDRFEKVAGNEYLELYFEKETLAIAIKNMANGYIWYSYPAEDDLSENSETKQKNIRSAVTITTMNVYTTNKTTVLDTNRVKTTINKLNNGFKATIDLTTFQIRFDLVVTIEGPEIVIEIPRESLEEYNPKLWQTGKDSISILDIDLYPYLGATSGEENGYIVIPDGIGALVELNEEPRSKRSYTQYVHGRDIGDTNANQVPIFQVQDVKPLQRITLPIFGVIHDAGNNGLLVVSEDGSQGSNYNYRVKGLESGYYQTYFSYVYRKTYTQFQSRATEDNILDIPKEPFDLNVKHRLFLLTGEEANYVGMAKAYRNFLERDKGLNQKVIPQDEYTTRIEMIGNEVTYGIFSEKNIATSKYNDIVELLETLKEDGYNNLDLSLKTYDTSKSAYRFNIMRSLGGKDDFENLLQYASDNGIDFSYFLDYSYNYGQTKETAKKMNSQPLTVPNLSYMYLLKYVNHSKSIIANAKSDLGELNKYGINEVTLEGFQDLTHTTNEKRQLVSIINNIRDVEKALQVLKDDEKSIATYNPDHYVFPYLNKYLNAPITSSELEFTDATVPLIPLILTGHVELFSNYLNFIENEEQSLLRLVEYGINPSYIMTTENTYELQYTNSSNIFISNYDSLKVRMERYDAVIREGLNAINGHELVNHQYLDNGITKSTFANGVEIVFNYTSQPYVYQGTEIKSNGYGVL